MPKGRKYNKKPRKYKRKFRRFRKVPSGRLIEVKLRKTGTMALSSTTTASNSSFKLNEFNAYDRWTNIYEQYRIVKITQKIYPMFAKGLSPILSTINVSDSGGDGSAVMLSQLVDCLLGWKIDRDDLTGFTSISDVLSNPSARVRSGFKNTTLSFKPNTLTNMYGPVADNHAIMYDNWIDTEDSSDIDYYGLCKLFHADGTSATYPIKYRIITEALVQFRNYRTDE